MHIYFSGIGGVGLGPLAEIAADAGYLVSGSDVADSPMLMQLRDRGIHIETGQDSTHIRNRHYKDSIDWLIYSSALPNDHPELEFARRRGIPISKRDKLLAYIIDQKSLALIAVAGTHGKTTTTAMLVWIAQQVGLPISYSIGAEISFGPSGRYDPQSHLFVYECDEYDRNFLFFHPYLSVITNVDYDHPDTYPTPGDYQAAFVRFVHQSQQVIAWPDTASRLGLPASAAWLHHPEPSERDITLPGAQNRQNAMLAVNALNRASNESIEQLAGLINHFPGTARRFEKLADNLYSDYGHHPVEIAATLGMARELSDHVVLVYQPHQNRRQHELKDLYTDCAVLAERIYWLPTYLTREDPGMAELTSGTLIENLHNKHNVVYADLNEQLWADLQRERQAGKLVIVMGAGNIDAWARQQLNA